MISTSLRTFIVLFSSLLTSIAYAQISEEAWKTFNNNTVNQFIIPAYKALSDSTTSLHESTQALCQAPSDIAIKYSQERFHQTMDAWQTIQNIGFGPIEYSMRSYSIQFWPDKKNHVGKHLAKLVSSGDQSLLTEERFPGAQVSVKGLPAIERLLFNQTALQDLKTDQYRCQVLTTISHHLVSIAHSLHSEWLEQMKSQFADAKQLDGYFEDDIDAATALLKTMIEPLEVIRDLKLKRPMGSSFGSQKYKRLESWRSKRSLRNIELNLLSLQHMFAGQNNKGGLSDLLPKQTFEEIVELYASLIKDVRQFESPLEEAIQTEQGYQAASRLYNKMGDLHTRLENMAADAGIHLGFNSRDGD